MVLREYECRGARISFRGAGPKVQAKPRTDARLETDNSFPVNKRSYENRAWMRGAYRELGLFRSEADPSINLALIVFFLWSPDKSSQNWLAMSSPIWYGTD
jgi:hypothetical protein